MFERIVVPLDGSTLAELALPYAEAIAGRTSAEIVLARVVNVHPSTEDELSARDVAAVGQAQEYAAGTAQGVVERGSLARSIVVQGYGPEATLDAVYRWRADLVVLAARPPGGLAGWASMAPVEWLLRRCPVPVLLVTPGHARTNPSTLVDSPSVVVPLDGSDYAERALPVAEQFTRTFHGRCVLLRAVQPYPYAGVSDECVGYDYFEAADTDEAEHYLRGAAGRLDTRQPAVRDVRLAEPAVAIAEASRQHGAALIVMSTHARAGFARWLAGSVAASATRRSSAPVLLLGPAFQSAQPPDGGTAAWATAGMQRSCEQALRHEARRGVQAAQSLVALPPKTPTVPPPGTSLVERLHRDLQAHCVAQERALAECGRLESAIGHPIVKFLLHIVAEGKGRQHVMLKRIEASLRDAIEWTHSPNALPEGHTWEKAETIRAARELVRLEREAERSARELATAYSNMDGGLDRLLLETLARECAARQRILRFAVAKLEEHQASESASGVALAARETPTAGALADRRVFARVRADELASAFDQTLTQS